MTVTSHSWQFTAVVQFPCCSKPVTLARHGFKLADVSGVLRWVSVACPGCQVTYTVEYEVTDE